jgi:hypothetical protein
MIIKSNPVARRFKNHYCWGAFEKKNKSFIQRYGKIADLIDWDSQKKTLIVS